MDAKPEKCTKNFGAKVRRVSLSKRLTIESVHTTTSSPNTSDKS